MTRDGKLDGKTKESTILGYGKVGHASIEELNGETGVYRRIGGGSRRDESAGIISSRTSEGGCRACVGGGRGGLYTKECFLTLGDVASNGGESVENERKEDKSAYLPVGSHDGRGYTVVAEKEGK